MIDLRFIGCNGGIGAGHGMAMRHTTCYGIGTQIVIDAGTGLGSLSLDELAAIDHVVLTHAHLDHVAGLPLMIDSVAAMRRSALTVWALPDVITILRAHLFNDKLWPDFSTIPTAEQPFLRFAAISDDSFEVAGHRFTPLPASHGIPACGYRVERDGVAIAFSGDTGDCPPFWERIADDDALAAVVVECSYPSRMTDMATLSMHLHAGIVAERLRELGAQRAQRAERIRHAHAAQGAGSSENSADRGLAGIVIHRKPGLEDDIAHELQAALPGFDLRLPLPGDRYRF